MMSDDYNVFLVSSVCISSKIVKPKPLTYTRTPGIDTFKEAVQVVTSKDGESTDDQTKDKKVIITIKKYLPNSPSLEDILLSDDFKNLPLLCISITGKTRGGKSLLLNLMIKYLESQGSEEWLTGTVPNCFKWKGGLESVTRGLWLWPKIYKRKSSDNREVGILLLDNAGLFDGEVTDGESIAMSGISTSISYIQMFNVKEKITCDYLEAIVRNLAKGIENLDNEMKAELSEDYRLMFVVRDWIGQDSHACGLQSGQDYIDTDRCRGSKDNKLLWQEVHKTFSYVQCLLLPHPGTVATKSSFSNTGDLSLLDQDFRDEVKTFVEMLFAPENLTLPATEMTGEHIYNMLMSAHGKVADDSLSFMNIFTDNMNYNKVENLKRDFNLLFSSPSVDLREIKSRMIFILLEADDILRGNSAPDYKAKLKTALEGIMNMKVVDRVLHQYEESFKYTKHTVNNHNCTWRNVRVKLHEYLCGDRSTREEINKTVAVNAANIYYKCLCNEIEKQFEANCGCIKELNELAGFGETTVHNQFKECTDFGNIVGNNAFCYPIFFKHQQFLKDNVSEILLKRVCTLTESNLECLKSARRKQYEYFEAFTLLNRDGGNWDTISKSDEPLLQKKIGYAMFGLPSESVPTPSGNQEMSSALARYGDVSSFSGKNSYDVLNFSRFTTNGEKTGYTTEQEENIKPISNKIVSLSELDPIKFSCIFVTFQTKGDIVSSPLFKIQTSTTEINYLDTNCRLYQDWEHFIATNTLPEVVYCHPIDGSYNKSRGFSVAFAKSPASNSINKALKKTDTLGNVVAGAAGVAAGVVVVAPAIPVLGVIAIIGGGVAGLYGVGRSVEKIWDKNQHGEPVKGKDVFELATNGLAVASMGAGAVAERMLAGALKVASTLISLNAIRVMFSSDDNPDLIFLLNEIADNSLKILFYFNVSSSPEAIKVIQRVLQLENDADNFKVLEALLEANGIQSTFERGETKMEKFVSQGVKTLVTSLLRTVSYELIHLASIYKNLHIGFEFFKNELIREQVCVQEVESTMSTLFECLQTENVSIDERGTYLICENSNSYSEVCNHFLELLKEKDGQHLILILRYIMFTISSKIKQANQFFNTIEHSAVRLNGCLVECHPLVEVTGQIRAMVEQANSASGLTSVDSELIDSFLKKILDLLYECAKPHWKSQQFKKCLLQIFNEITDIFEDKLNNYKDIVKANKNLNCSDLVVFFKKLGMEGNYGACLLQKVFNKFEANKELTYESDISSITVLPAWSGLLPHLYCYYSSKTVASKMDLVQEVESVKKENYSEIFLSGYPSLSVWKPCEGGSLRTFVVYSSSKGETESGLIYFDK